MDDKIILTGLIGEHIEHSFSPFIQQCFINYYEVKYIYLPFPITSNELNDALQAIKVLKMRGVNITIPFKERSLQFMDKTDQSVAQIGALNTVVREGNELCAYNTDWIGFQKTLQEKINFDFTGKKAVILGAGGSARAIVYALLVNRSSEISIFNRSYDRALEIKKNFQALYPHCKINIFSYLDHNLKTEVESTDLLINTTPLGSWYYPDRSPIPNFITFPSKAIIYDLVYYPDKTPLLKKAEQNGNFFFNGKPMLVYQAAESFYLWTGIKPDQNIINQILNKI